MDRAPPWPRAVPTDAQQDVLMPQSQNDHGERQLAVLEMRGGPVSFRAKVRMTPGGILAVGGLVTGILLSTSVLVWTATSAARRHPLASRIKPR